MRVVWHEKALEDLAAIWLASEQQQAVTESVTRIDRILRTDPSAKGVDFYGDRLLVVLPLAVVYAVKDQDRIVEILAATASQNT
jgi:plasmid stabilization system protein ParE